VGGDPVTAGHPKSRTVRDNRAEGFVQVLIMLAIGAAAGAASFTHVHNVAASHGQPGWLAWADAIVLELMSIASGLELRRRRRAAAPTTFPAIVLGCAVTLSLTAQVVEAEPSPIGWTAAAVPALGFLVMVKWHSAIPPPSRPGHPARRRPRRTTPPPSRWPPETIPPRSPRRDRRTPTERTGTGIPRRSGDGPRDGLADRPPIPTTTACGRCFPQHGPSAISLPPTGSP
jgi:uncharacterized protein DUF2637